MSAKNLPAGAELRLEHSGKTTKFTAPLQWDQQIWQQNPIFAELAGLFPLADCKHFPAIDTLDQWRSVFRPNLAVRFVENSVLAADGRYYEEFIFASQQVPTRADNWHDLFGALIWCQFPKTKTLLNHLHMQEIAVAGLTKRTVLRNKLTLFDECGVLLLYQASAAAVVEALRQHQWLDAFVGQRPLWQGQSNQPALAAMMFGHANYEMATRPFIGLTGKMLALEVCADFFDWSLRERLDFIDTALSTQIANSGILLDHRSLTPLPILGVPGWDPANQQADFYRDPAYFRPKRPS